MHHSPGSLAIKDKRVQDAILKLKTSPDHAWTTENLARECGISRSRLQYLFRLALGTSIKCYLRWVRIALAMRLLTTQPQLKIWEVGEKCGFPNESHFCRVFNKETKLSPKVYRDS